MSSEYGAFLARKAQLDGGSGFAPTFEHPMAYDFQAHLIDWAVRQGRASLFADCGLGKTLMQLSWAQNVVEHTNRPVLVIAPLMVSVQTSQEAEKFGLEARRSLDGSLPSAGGIVTTNYERLHRFDASKFSGVVCDESSIIKNFEGSRKSEITEFMRRVPYRLLCSATPSPNDYIELGTSAEALGHMGYMDMLSMFFKNDENSLHPAFIGSKWRFKHHAEMDFWRWVCSWARAVRRPSDIGFDNGGFTLPPLVEREHVIASEPPDGYMFAVPVVGLSAERSERSTTLDARCDKAAELLGAQPSGVSWCHLNAEADGVVQRIPGAEQISGGDSDERKEELLLAFKGGAASPFGDQA